jgi:hypothetical protein
MPIEYPYKIGTESLCPTENPFRDPTPSEEALMIEMDLLEDAIDSLLEARNILDRLGNENLFVGEINKMASQLRSDIMAIEGKLQGDWE